MFHIGWFLTGSQAQAWNLPWSGNIGRDWMRTDLYIDILRSMERACVDFVLLEDHTYVFDTYNQSMKVNLETATSTPRLDPVLMATVLSQATSKIGIVPTINTFAYHPYLAARMIGTLDQLSMGRAGWNMVTGSSDSAARNYGLDKMWEHDRRYDLGAEFIQAANALWDTWEDGAVVADLESGVFIDHTKVHHANFEGEFFSTRGPLNSGPAPQGRPVLAQAGNSPKGRSVGAAYADVIIAAEDSVENMKAFREDIRRRMVEAGRNPDDCKVLFIASPVVGIDDADVEAKILERRRRGAQLAEARLATMSAFSDLDFGQFPIDEPLDDRAWKTNGLQNMFKEFIAAGQGQTLREAGAWMVESYHNLGLTGTLDAVASRMKDIMDEVGGDGFLFASVITRKHVAELTDGLLPLLQRRGLIRSEYGSDQLRDNLRAF
ncbi:MAG: NtaA/DmoA family FMN-dependent monooxygenase [Novosphingobium sp.]